MKNLKTIAIALLVAFGTTVATAQTKKIDAKKSTINWVGKKVTGEHSGSVNFKEGNLIFKGTARNFNPCMCGAAKITVAEVEEMVPLGSLDPNFIHIPGIFVQRIFQGKKYEKRIEQRTVRQRV